jgi:hypothetical protein
LIPGQVALGTVLLTSAGVLVKTVHELKAGIALSAPERIWFADLQMDTMPSTVAAFDDFQANFRARVTEMPGAEAAGLATGRPLANHSPRPVARRRDDDGSEITANAVGTAAATAATRSATAREALDR